ncbi:hypothetical protein [Methylobacterium nodulans]|uniref:Uncharacterized protein n=1 Tax=Methylobacterium nodulans (strain LMG 21967 / CNCM I-2342 / ORS 2060) TaxID=460265 RepID=B8IU75_METNO|nr:hypothetical protein [Methylobacterium nodulans]ACL55120.1 conserved hypothetical protein [Methylobacterium nodulans ORS 2060]
MINAADALSRAQRAEYAAKGRSDLDRRLARLSPDERNAFWKAVNVSYASALLPAPDLMTGRPADAAAL